MKELVYYTFLAWTAGATMAYMYAQGFSIIGVATLLFTTVLFILSTKPLAKKLEVW